MTRLSRVLLVSANREKLPEPVVPLGVLAVAGALRGGGRDVSVADLCFECDPLESLRRAIEHVEPDAVGIGIRNLHDNAYGSADELIAYYRDVVHVARSATRAPLILGGAGFSLQPETLIEALGADHGVVGEGETAFPRLLDALANGEAVARIVRSPAGPLDALPCVARDLVDDRYHHSSGVQNVQTKRGCVFDCAYCDYPDLEGRVIRVRDPMAVADEVIAFHADPRVSHVFFVDSVFNVPRRHALAVCDALLARGSTLPWVCYASPVSLDDELVGAMARAGCVGMEIGSDSGTARTLKRLRKPFGLASIARARDLLRAHGIADCHTFVLGAMDETLEETKETLDFVTELNPDVAVFVVFMEERETRSPRAATHRDAILSMLEERAKREPRWSVPELGIRFGPRISRFMQRMRLKGPAWLHLARSRATLY